jgi:hypothetical protein
MTETTRQSIRDRTLMRLPGAEREAPAASAAPAPQPARRLLRNIGLAGLLVVLVAGAVVASLRAFPALGNLVAGDASAQAQKTADNAPAAGDTPFGKHADEAGVRTCANVFAALGQAVTAGSTYAVQTQWDNSAPDAHSMQAVAGMTYDLPDYKAQAAGVVFASPLGKGCEGGFVRVAPFRKSCQEVAATLPKGSVLADTLAASSLFNLADNGGQALLVPEGNTCIVVSVARMGG